MAKARIIKKKISEHQWKYGKKYDLKRKTFYRVLNPAGETIGDFPTKKKALNFAKGKVW